MICLKIELVQVHHSYSASAKFEKDPSNNLSYLNNGVSAAAADHSQSHRIHLLYNIN